VEEAEGKLAEFRTQVNKQRSAESPVIWASRLIEFVRVSEVEEAPA
jgi:hypothetical protein